MEGTSNMLDGSVKFQQASRETFRGDVPSRRSRSGSQKSALANANLILQPPEKVLVALCCFSSEKPKPASMLAARDSALSDSISESFA